MSDVYDNKSVAPRYVHGFHCIGSACEDDCCHGWKINIDRDSFKKLKRVMGKAGPEREQFQQSVKRNRSSATDSNYASLVLGVDGACSFLDPASRLCLIHGKYGEACLSKVCMTYPRELSWIGERLEMTLSISCPEVARRCLLSRQSMDILPLEIKGLPLKRYTTASNVSGGGEDSYSLHFDLVREVLLQLLAAREYPLEVRLFFCAWFAHRIAPFFIRGSQTEISSELAAEIDRLVAPDMLETLSLQYQQVQIPVDWSLSAILTILYASNNEMAKPKSAFGELLRKIWTQHGVLSGEVLRFSRGENGDVDFTPQNERYLYLRNKVQLAFGDDLELYLENYCRNYWFSEPRNVWPSIMEQLQDMFIRLATIKFLLCSHPQVVDLISVGVAADEAVRKGRFAELVVEVFYSFSRGREHSPVFKQKILEAVQENQMQSFAHQILFLKT